MISEYSKLLEALKSLSGETLISFHSRGDVEAVASALTLQGILRSSTVKSPDRVSGHARGVLRDLRVKELAILKKGELAHFDNIVLVDVSSPAMLGIFESEFNSFKGKKIVIDHHVTTIKFKRAEVFEFPNRTSCCEVVYDVAKIGNFPVDEKTALLLLCGVVVDSGGFQSANENTFRATASLLRLSKVSYSKVKQIVRKRVSLNEVKTIQDNVTNTRLVEHNGEVVAFCSCKSFESATAEVLIKSGASVAVCFNEKNGSFTVTKSNSSKVFESLNSAKLLAKTTAKFKGNSGGHELIAGGNVTISKVEAAVLFLERELRNIRWS